MKILVEKEKFLTSLSPIVANISLRPNLPVLSNILFNTNTGRLEMISTNLETTVKVGLGVKVIESGEVTIPARLLFDFCQNIKDQSIEISTEKDLVYLKAGNAQAELPTINVSEFPQIPEFEAAESETLEKKVLIDAVTSVSFCAAPEQGRPVLTGVFFNGQKEKLTIVATDGYRLGKIDIKNGSQVQAIIPARTLSEAVKAFAGEADESLVLSMDKNKNQVKIEGSNLTIISRLIEGSYPNYDQIIPREFVCTAKIKVSDLTDALKLTSLFARETGNVVSLEIGPREIKVIGNTAQVGEANAIVKAETEGDQIKIAFNSRFLLDSLNALSSEEAEISLSGITSAAVLKGADRNLIYVIMPVRVQG